MTSPQREWLRSLCRSISRADERSTSPRPSTALADERAAEQPGAIIARSNFDSAQSLRVSLRDAERKEQSAVARMVYWQEELDWELYVRFRP